MQDLYSILNFDLCYLKRKTCYLGLDIVVPSHTIHLEDSKNIIQFEYVSILSFAEWSFT